MAIRIGTSGWSYAHWGPELYPPGLSAAAGLDRYAATFGTAGRSSSFYRWPRPDTFRYWKRKLPAGFRMSVKGLRGLTHARELYGPQTWLQRMSAGWHELGGKRAVPLVQPGPAQAGDDARLDYFLQLVPEWMRVAVGVPPFQLALRGGVRAAGGARGGLPGRPPGQRCGNINRAVSIAYL